MTRASASILGRTSRRAASTLSSCALALGLSACAAASAKKPPPAAPAAPTAPDAPRKDPPAARALDPDPSAGACAGYVFDGMAIGMPLSEVERNVALTTVPREDGQIPGFEGHTFAFQATRPRRLDNVQIGVGRKDTVEYVHASVLVTNQDTWPRSLFEALGSPKHARYSEWVWYDTVCGVTLRLDRLESLGGGDDASQGYTLEIKRTLKPVPD